MTNPQTLDEESYQSGRNAFAAGATLRSIIEEVHKADTVADEEKTLAGLVGFVDGLIDAIRRRS